MKRFLMCEPKFFEVCYVINPWMEGNLGKVDRDLAARQWENLYRLVSKLASVILIEPVAGLPDMVFTANAGLVQKNAAGENRFVVSSFLHAERQPEAQFFANFFSSQGYRVQHLPGKPIFEGAGDALFDSDGRLWTGYGIRSAPHALQAVSDLLKTEVCGLELVNPRWYHLDTAFCPLPDGQAFAYAGAFSGKSVATLKQVFAENIIWVSELDAKNFACNSIPIGRKIIMHHASAELKSALRQRGFEVMEADVSEFLKAGGACKCLTLEI